jgi:probable F420-dependent oxidoreductase
MTRYPFRFGVNVYGATTRDEWIAKALKVEALGYDTFFVADHLGCFPPLAGMMAAAAATTRLRIGSNVFANDFRHPIMLAREVAAVDALSNGRVVLGLGTGFYRPDYDQSGITLDLPGTRVSRLEEAVQIIKGVFTKTSFSFSGQYYTVRDVSLTPTPVQQPHPPLLLGGASPRILALAAREADIVSFNIRTTANGGFDHSSILLDPTIQKVAWVKQAAGARLEALEFSIMTMMVAVTDDPLGAAQQMVDQWHNAGFSIEQVLQSPHNLIGSVEKIVADLQQRREEYGFSYIVISENKLEEFAPIVARLAGT